MAVGPLILLRGRALMVDARLRDHLWLLIPGTAYWLYQLWAFTLLGDYEAKWEYPRAVHAPSVFPAVTLPTWLMIGGCVARVFVLRRRYIVWLKDNHAENEPFDPAWQRHLILIVKIAVSIWYEFDYIQSFGWDFVALFFIFVIALEALLGIHQTFPKMAQASPPIEPNQEPAPLVRQGAPHSSRRQRHNTVLKSNPG